MSDKPARQRPRIFLLWGAVLSALFFYPLVGNLEYRPFMMWSPANTAELLLAFLLLAAILGILARLAAMIPSERLRLVVFASVCLIPFASFLSSLLHLLSLNFKVFLVGAEAFLRQHPSLGAPPVLLGAAFAWICWRRSRAVLGLLQEALLILSPVVLIAVVGVVRFGLGRRIVTEIRPAHAPTASLESAPKAPKNIYIFLFDETSYDYLYERGSVRSDFPNIKAFSEMSENYHSALSAGTDTDTSIPGFLAGKRFHFLKGRHGALWDVPDSGPATPVDLDSVNIFRRARASGYKTVVVGWYLAYCDKMFFGNSLDSCDSVSYYNHAAVTDGFSPLNPVYTVIMNWPRQFPFGLLQTPVYSIFHSKTVKKIHRLSTESFAIDGPVFEFIHFSIPHQPFVFDGDGFRPAQYPYLQNSENYIRQLRYVDRLFGELLAELKKNGRFSNSDIMFISDHAYRVMAKPGEKERIPLLLKRAGRIERRDLHGVVKAEELLKELVESGR